MNFDSSRLTDKDMILYSWLGTEEGRDELLDAWDEVLEQLEQKGMDDPEHFMLVAQSPVTPERYFVVPVTKATLRQKFLDAGRVAAKMPDATLEEIFPNYEAFEAIADDRVPGVLPAIFVFASSHVASARLVIYGNQEVGQA